MCSSGACIAEGKAELANPFPLAYKRPRKQILLRTHRVGAAVGGLVVVDGLSWLSECRENIVEGRGEKKPKSMGI